jgi:hypothetical protein
MFTIVAVLFVGQVVHVAYEDQHGAVRSFQLQNSEPGAEELVLRLRPVLNTAQGRPMVCMGAAEGSSLHGPVFERAVFDDSVRRFMYAQPKYLLEAKALQAMSTDPEVLLRLCYGVFAPVKRGAT